MSKISHMSGSVRHLLVRLVGVVSLPLISESVKRVIINDEICVSISMSQDL